MATRERTFKHYFDLPAEARNVINEEMEPDGMCRLTRCSKLCNKEVTRSNKYIFGLKFDNSSERRLKIEVDHARDYYEYRYKYQVVFQANPGQKCMKYSILTGDGLWRELWKVDLDSSMNLVQVASEYFKDLLEFHQNSIKLLTITRTWNYDVEVRSLNNLKCLDLRNCVGNIVEVISRRQKPLEDLTYYGEMNERFVEIDIYQVQRKIHVPKLTLSIEQYRRLSTECTMLHIGEMSPNDIFNFITSWQNGQLRENFIFAHWDLSDSNFNVHELWRLLEVEPDDPQWTQIRIDDNLEAGRVAVLHHLNYENERLIFRFVPQPIH